MFHWTRMSFCTQHSCLYVITSSTKTVQKRVFVLHSKSFFSINNKHLLCHWLILQFGNIFILLLHLILEKPCLHLASENQENWLINYYDQFSLHRFHSWSIVSLKSVHVEPYLFLKTIKFLQSLPKQFFYVWVTMVTEPWDRIAQSV